MIFVINNLPEKRYSTVWKGISVIHVFWNKQLDIHYIHIYHYSRYLVSKWQSPNWNSGSTMINASFLTMVPATSRGTCSIRLVVSERGSSSEISSFFTVTTDSFWGSVTKTSVGPLGALLDPQILFCIKPAYRPLYLSLILNHNLGHLVRHYYDSIVCVYLDWTNPEKQIHIDHRWIQQFHTLISFYYSSFLTFHRRLIPMIQFRAFNWINFIS